MYRDFCFNEEMPRKTIREAIVERFKMAKENGIYSSQDEFAVAAGLKPARLSHYFTGKRPMDEEVILLLCRALGLRWQDLDVDTGVKRSDALEKIRLKLDQLTDLSDEELQSAWRTMETMIELIRKTKEDVRKSQKKQSPGS